MKLLSLTFTLFICNIFQLNGQTPYAFFKNYTTDHGLPTDRIRALAQDNQGYIWIATNAGLCRFDGSNFEVFQNQKNNTRSISSDNIVKVEAGDGHHLWIGHYEAGVDLFDTQTGTLVLNINETLPNNRVTELWNEPDKQRVWIGTLREMWVWFDLKTNKIVKPKIKPHPKNSMPLPATNSIFDILQDPKNRNLYWLATNEGLGLYNETTNTLQYFHFDGAKSGINTNDRLRSIFNKDHFLYLAARGNSGLIRFNTEDHSFVELPLGKAELLLLDIIPKDSQNIWIASANKSLGWYNTTTKKYSFFNHNPEYKFSILPGSITDLLADKQGNVWIATSKGLSLWSPENQKFQFKPLGHKLNDFNKPLTFIDNKDYLYIGLSETNGLPIYSKSNGKITYSLPKQPTQLSIQRFSKDSFGNIWLVASGKLYKYSNQKLEYISLPEAMNNILLHSIFFGKGDALFLGTRFDGLFRWDLKKNIVKQLSVANGNLASDRFLHEMIFDNNGKLWVGTEQGISIVDTANFSVVKNISKEHNLKVVYRLALDKEGLMWASTENQGVLGFSTNTYNLVRRITKEDGLPSDAIQHIVIDNENKLWIATQQGLVRYSSESLEVFTKENGLVENQLEASLNLLESGKIVQGYDNGFAIFNPEEIKTVGIPNQPKIISFKVLGRKIPLTSKINLQPDENFFSVRFSSIDFTHPHLIKYAYRLSGFSDEWIYTTNLKEIEYNKVRFGEYVFEVKSARIGTNDWSGVESIHIVINPPFYFRLWFIALILCSFFAAIYYAYQKKISKVQLEERKDAEIKRRLFTSELRALRSQMNPHFLYNCINSIKYFVITNNSAQAATYLNKFAKLMRKILNNSQYEFITLEEETDTLRLYLEMEQLRFEERMEFRLNVDSNLNPATTKIPTMLIQPIVENAIWHGIMQKKTDDGFVWIDLEEEANGKLHITITDNGIGRTAAVAIKATQAKRNKSLGMEMTASRIQNLNEMHNLEIICHTTDLYNAEGEASGTKVELHMNLLTNTSLKNVYPPKK